MRKLTIVLDIIMIVLCVIAQFIGHRFSPWVVMAWVGILIYKDLIDLEEKK